MTTSNAQPMTEDQFVVAIDLACKLHTDPVKRAEVLVTLAGCDYPTLAALISAMKANLGMIEAPAAPAKIAVPAYLPPAGTYKIDGATVDIKISKSTKLPYLVVNGGYMGAPGKTACAKYVAALDTPEKAEAALVAYAKATGKCGICHKTLTDPVSIAQGIGPVCKKKIYG